jgi:hypothetical protein
MASMGVSATSDTTPRPDQVLGLAIERSYQTFAHHQVGRSMVVRRGDIAADEIAALGGPVRSVAAAAIDRWLPHAVTTWGTAEDLRALLPRVCELLTAGLLTTPPEVVFAKVRQSGLADWPLDEVGAFDDIVSALWLATLTQHPAAIGHPAMRVLASIAELGHELSRYLDDWLLLVAAQGVGEPARRHLVDLARRVQHLQDAGIGVDGLFWSPWPDEAHRLELWITSPVVTPHLARH